FNGMQTLPRCLESVFGSSLQAFEVILVDDGSTDESAAYARSKGARVLSTGGRRGPAFARNIGAREASSSVLVFVDADVAIHSDVLLRFSEHFERSALTAAVMGSYNAAPLDPSTVSTFKNLMHHYVHQHSAERASSFWAGLGAIRADVFRQLGGFDTSYERP